MTNTVSWPIRGWPRHRRPGAERLLRGPAV